MFEITENVKVKYKLFGEIYLRDLMILSVIGMVFFTFRSLFHPMFRTPIIISALLMGVYFLSSSSLTPFYSRYQSFYAGMKYTKEPIYYGSGKSTKRLTSSELLLRQVDDGGVFNNGESFGKILEVAPRDLYSLNEDNIKSLISRVENFYNNYHEDLKWITMRFPVDYKGQKDYLKSLKNEGLATSELVDLKIKELEILEKESQNLEYFLSVYGKTENQLNENISQVKYALSGELQLLEIGTEKTIKLLTKMMNQNTRI